MKILMLGDTHGVPTNVTTVLASLEKPDAIMQVGDFGGVTALHFKKMIEAMKGVAQEHQIPVYFIDGNHEHFPSLKQYKDEGDVHYLSRGSRWLFDSRRLGVLGGAFSVDFGARTDGVDWFKDDEQVKIEDLLLLGPRELDVLISHDTGIRHKPNLHGGFKLDEHREFVCSINQHLIQTAIDITKPAWHFHGHWHDLAVGLDEQTGTRVVSLGCNPNDNHVVFDTADMKVYSEYPDWQRRLDLLNDWKPSSGK